MESKRSRRASLSIITLIVFATISAGIELGGAVYIPWKIHDRYKYIERSDRLFSQGKYEKALFYAEKVYNKNIKPSNNRSTFFILSYLYRKTNHWETKEKINYYQVLINLAYCFQASGNNIEKAEQLFLETIDFSAQTFPNEKEYLILPTMGCAKIYIARGDNVSAENCYYELIDLLNELDKKDVYNIIEVLDIYATFAEKNGEIQRAFKLHKEALDVYNRSKKSKENAFYLRLMTNVARDYIEMNNQSEAEKILRNCKKAARENKDISIYISYLDLLSQMSEMKGDYLTTERLLNTIINRVRRNQGRNHIDYALSIYKLAAYYFRQGDYFQASQKFNESLDIASQHKINQKIVYHDILLGTAISDYFVGNIKDFEDKTLLVEAFLINQINEVFMFLSHEEKESYISSNENRFIQINSILAMLNKPEINGRLYNNILATKGIALQSNQFFKKYLFQTGSNDLLNDYSRLLEAKEKSIELKYAGTINDSLFNRRNDSNRIEERRILSLIRESEKFTDFQVNSVSWKDIRNSIDLNEAVVEFIRLPPEPSRKEEIWYYALVLRQDYNFPLLVKLCEESKLVKILNQDGNTKERIDKIYSAENISELRNLIWQPIKNQISDSDKIYISIAGILYQISFPAIVQDEKSEIVFLSSTRNLLERKSYENSTPDSTSILYGNIDYFGTPDSDWTNNQTFVDTLTKEINKNILRSEFQLLPGTANEILSIKSILEYHNIKTKLYTGNEATEETFKNISNEQPSIIHVATHGFYFPPSLSYRVNELLFDVADYSATIQNPLFRSGILFSGVNNRSKDNNEEDGVLTAYEISQIDLSEVNLVVLSACETGLGEIRGSEGVYGLQRAFRLAGVQSTIISLWKIPDIQTSELMQGFYKYYLEDYSKQTALMQAQMDLMKKYPSPFYWAGFTIVE